MSYVKYITVYFIKAYIEVLSNNAATMAVNIDSDTTWYYIQTFYYHVNKFRTKLVYSIMIIIA